MTLIYTAAELALRRERSADELKAALRQILREAKRCTELIQQLLTLARCDAGERKAEFTASDVSELLREVTSEAGMMALSKEMTVDSRVPPGPVMLPIDTAAFRRLLLILLDNAIQYSNAGGSVSLSLIENASHVEIAVADTGCGISAENLPFVFDRFWRADQVRSRDAGGAGLGLAIAREIAASHAAELSVESEAGRGSIFTIRLRKF